MSSRGSNPTPHDHWRRVQRAASTYNAIMGRTRIHVFKAVPSTYHMVLKFRTKTGVGKEKGDHKMARSCYVAALRPDRTGRQVIPMEAANMPVIDPDLITHKLNVDLTRKAMQQKKRTYAPDRLEAIKQEVEKLFEAGFIEEVQFTEWLANPVMVKKANEKWRMFIDFTDLNDAFPKDCYPLSRIDTLIDATAGHEMLSFMDGFNGYNQIKMHKNDTHKELLTKVITVTPEEGENDKEEDLNLKEYWVLHFDGASKTKYSGAGLVLQSPKGFMIEYALKLDFPTTNNEAEYEALIAGLGLARAVRAMSIKICGDFKLVVAQVNGEFEAKNDAMAKYLRVVKGILTQIDEWYAEHVPREENTTANALSKFASSEIENYPRSIYLQVLRTPIIHAINLIAPIGSTSCWIDPIKNHLETGLLPDDAQKARKLSVRALSYYLIEGLLYKRSFVIPYLKCLRPHEAEDALKEAHEVIYE
ncbi:uncharacterized protein LOC141686435 [Apium graveolens]|uniref:uncharacterized protein LOC141686435 n=1 Tax=Apium graveolens TaxID=4045 RepID=UPI003D79C633